ncbi:hypothetical protein Emag_003316 [Eimeria magna]
MGDLGGAGAFAGQEAAVEGTLAASPASALGSPGAAADEEETSGEAPSCRGITDASASDDCGVGRSSLAAMTERFLSLDFDSLGKALERFKFDPRLAVAFRVPSQAGMPSVAVQPEELPPPPPPLDFHRVYSSVDTLLAVHEQQALQVYAESCPQMLVLDKKIEDSERLLAGVEARLHALSEDLGASGANTRSVEQQSSALATKARNRREAYLLLRTYLQQITLTRDLVKAICEGSLDSDPKTFLKALKELEKKIEHAKQPGMRQYKSSEASLPELYKLRDCAAQRITGHIQQRISLLRQPRTNIHIIQRGELLKHKELYLFLTDQAPSSAVAVKDEYTRTISAVYASLFKTYHNQLLGMLLDASSLQPPQGSATTPGAPAEAILQADADDYNAGGGKASGSLVASARQVMGFLTRLGSGSGGSGNQQTPPSLLCSLGARDSILHDLDAEPLVAVPTLRSLSTADARRTSTVSVGGFSFTRGPSAESASSKDDGSISSQGTRQNARTLFYEQLFRSHQKLFLDTATSELIFLTDFFLNAGLDTHYQSLFNEVFSKTKAYFISALQDVLQGSADAIGVMLMLRINQHNRATSLSCAVASTELSSALAYLQQPIHGLAALPEEPLRSLLIELQTAALDVLKVSLHFFLPRWFSFDVCCVSWRRAKVCGSSIAQTAHAIPIFLSFSVLRRLEHLLWECVGAYVEEQLEEHFGDLVASVRAAEGILTTDPTPENPAALFDLAQLERAVLTQLLLQYTRLQQIVNTCFPKPPQPAWARQLVPVNTILTEVRRFSRGI